MIKLLMAISFIAFAMCSYGELPPLKYTYNSPTFSCKIDDFELENDLDIYSGSFAENETGDELKEYQKERESWRKNPLAFKKVQMDIAPKIIEKIFSEFTEKTLLNDKKLRERLKCYLTMFDLHSLGRKEQGQLKVSFESLQLHKVYDLNLFEAITFRNLFLKVIEEEYLKDKKFLKVFNDGNLDTFVFLSIFEKIKLTELSQKEREEIAINFINFKKYENLPNGTSLKSFVLKEILLSSSSPDKRSLLEIAAEEESFPIIETFILKNADFNEKRLDKILTIDFVNTLVASDKIPLSKKCSAIQKVHEFVLKDNRQLRNAATVEGIRKLLLTKVKCSFQFEEDFLAFDPSTDEFIKKWCLEKSSESCTFNQPSIRRCRKSSDCKKIKVEGCGVQLVNINARPLELEALEQSCKNPKIYHNIEPKVEELPSVCSRSLCWPDMDKL